MTQVYLHALQVYKNVPQGDLMDFASRLLNKLPPFLDGYAAIVKALEDGDPAHAWYLATQFDKSAQQLKKSALEVYERQEEVKRSRS